jgi:prepilin-type processing-associated H-X9-DG protein
MAEVPPYQFPETPPPPVRKSNTTLIWVIVIVGLLGLCMLMLFMAAILFPVFSEARLAAMRTACLSNVKQVSLASLIYAADWDDKLPSPNGWADQIEDVMTESMHCPEVRRDVGRDTYGYALNAFLAGKKSESFASPETAILVFETEKLERNASGGEADLAQKRHGNRPNVAFLDGHAGSFTGTVRGEWRPQSTR